MCLRVTVAWIAKTGKPAWRFCIPRIHNPSIHIGIPTTASSNSAAVKVHSAYCNLLNRCADQSGLQFWTGLYATNNNMTTVVLNIVVSGEFETKHIMGNPDPVNVLYQKCLLRNADPSK